MSSSEKNRRTGGGGASWSHQRGVGMIEVLVAVLLVSFGVLGAVAMHVRDVEFTTDTQQRQMASDIASSLMETMRSDYKNTLDAKGMPRTDLGGYAKAAGTAFGAVETADCTTPDVADPAKRRNCWGLRAMQLMPSLTTNLLTQRFVVKADANGVVTVTVAWPVKKGQCLGTNVNDSENEYCTFSLQSRL